VHTTNVIIITDCAGLSTALRRFQPRALAYPVPISTAVAIGVAYRDLGTHVWPQQGWGWLALNFKMLEKSNCFWKWEKDLE